MVHQPISFTKRFSKCALVLGVALLALGMAAGSPALALIKMNRQGIDAALVYGMKNQKQGLANLLGPNWVEGSKGSLLNVYSPFMVLATKSAKGKFPISPTPSDLKKAREKYGRHVSFYSDPKNRLEVKFAVSFYGDSPTFAQGYEARIVGFGRGKEFEIKPSRRYLDQKADPVENGLSSGLYEAINAYYFNFSELENLQEFRLILSSPQGEPLVFRLNNERLY